MPIWSSKVFANCSISISRCTTLFLFLFFFFCCLINLKPLKFSERICHFARGKALPFNSQLHKILSDTANLDPFSLDATAELQRHKKFCTMLSQLSVIYLMTEDNQAFSPVLIYESIRQDGKQEYVASEWPFWGMMAACLRRTDQFGYFRSDWKACRRGKTPHYVSSQSRKHPVVLHPSFSLVPPAKHWAVNA